MKRLSVGFVGYRGMVGGVLMERMIDEGDFARIEAVFFSTSSPGAPGPVINDRATVLADAYDIAALAELDVIVSCQGSDYTKRVYDELRRDGWAGYWIDAASELRMRESSILVLDPVNGSQLQQALDQGTKDLIGANCTVSTMLMGLAGLFKHDLIEWANPSSYQAVSGAGAQYVRELLHQMRELGHATASLVDNPASSLAQIDQQVNATLHSADFPVEQFGHPIAANVLPWIDSEVSDGQSREEWKAEVEANRLLGTQATPVRIDGTCVRVGSMRSHAQAVTLKLKRDIALNEVEQIISDAHEWVSVVPNTREATLSQLTPAAISGSLQIGVGRIRKLSIGSEYLSTFVVGDQLLWGAAEPLRRVLNILVDRQSSQANPK